MTKIKQLLFIWRLPAEDSRLNCIMAVAMACLDNEKACSPAVCFFPAANHVKTFSNPFQPLEAAAQSARGRPTLKARMMRQMSDAVNKVSAKLADKRSHSLGEPFPYDKCTDYVIICNRSSPNHIVLLLNKCPVTMINIPHRYILVECVTAINIHGKC